MLSEGMRDEIEYIQKRACKLIFGWNSSYDLLIQDKKIVTLQERREKLFEIFCNKIHKNDRFRRIWIEERVFEDHQLRKQKIIREKFASTNRLYNSPLYALRRKLNDILVT